MAITRWNDFSGGLNTRLRQNLIADNESPALRNVWWRESGSLRKRGGITGRIQLAISTLAGLGIMRFSRGGTFRLPGSTTSSRYRTYILNGYAVGGSLTALHESNEGVSTFTDVGASFTEEGVRDITSFNGNIYIGTALRYNGTTTATVTGAPDYLRSVAHKNYLFGAGVKTAAANGDRLQWTALGTSETWPASNFIDISLTDGLYINSISSFQDSLVIFKGPFIDYVISTAAPQTTTGVSSNSAWILYGDTFDPTNPSYELKRLYLPHNLSCLYGASTLTWGGFLVFLSNMGLIGYDGGNFINLTDKIKTSFDNWNLRQNNGNSSIVNSIDYVSTVWDNCYVMNASELPSPIPSVKQSWLDETGVAVGYFHEMNALYIITPEKTWWRWTSPRNFYRSVFIDSKNRLSFSGYPSPELFSTNRMRLQYWRYDPTVKSDDNDDNATTGIDAMWTSKEFDFKEFQHFQKAYVHFKRQGSGNLTFEVNVDQSGFVPTTFPMSSTSGSILRSPHISAGMRKGRTIQFRVSNAEAVDMEIFEIELHHSSAGPLN